jgi:hypothetical protein
MSHVSTVEFDHIPPVKGLHNVIRASGYTAEDCILELTDNAIDAKAKEIEIILYPRSSENPTLDKVLVMDTGGKGMNLGELQAAITIAHQRMGRENDIGAYGMGMKSASVNMGDELTVLTKRSDSQVFIGARLDFIDQERSNSYSPTQISQNAATDLFTQIPSDMRTRLSRMNGTPQSATVIQVSKLLVEMASIPCEGFRSRLINRLQIAYSANALSTMKFTVKIAGEAPSDTCNVEQLLKKQCVKLHDPFYSANWQEKLRCAPITLEFFAIIPHRQSEGIRVIEKNTSKRRCGGKNGSAKFTSGTPEAPVYYELAAESMKVVANPLDVQIPDTKPPIPFNMKFSFLKVSTYDEEDDDMRRKGIWFQRGPRVVAQGLTLGIHGIGAHGHYNQMRALVEFPPSLDQLMGGKYNKQINPKTGALKDAVVRVWKDITTPWIAEKEAARKPKRQMSLDDVGIHVNQANADVVNEATGVNEQAEEEIAVPDHAEEVVEVEVEEEEEIALVSEIRISDRMVQLVRGTTILCSANGFGKNSQLKMYLQALLEKQGEQKTLAIMNSIQQILAV